MGIENRNESTERPEQVEQFREQDSHKGEECKKELGSLSDFKDDNADKTEYSKSLEDKEKKDEAVRVEDMSDLEKSSDKSKEATLGEKSTETPVEEYNVPNREVETATIDESNKFEKIEASTPENSEQSSKDLTLENNLEACESDSKNVVDNEEIKTNGTSNDTAEAREEHVGDTKHNVEHHNNSVVRNSESYVIEQEQTYPRTYKEYLDSMPDGQKETHNKISNICYSFAEKHLTKEDQTKLDNGKCVIVDLSESEKGKLSKDITKKLDETFNNNPDNLDNLRSYTAESIKGVKVYPGGKAEVIQDWDRGGHSDGAVPGTRTMEVIQKDTIIDRIGPPYREYACPLKEDGTPYSDAERAIGFESQTPNIEDNMCYHKYKVLQDLSKENIESAILNKYNGGSPDFVMFESEGLCDECKNTDEDKAWNYLMALESYYQDCNDPTSDDHYGDVYCAYVDYQDIDGIKKGVIESKFGNDGRGNQYIFPFDISTMCDLGLIKEL